MDWFEAIGVRPGLVGCVLVGEGPLHFVRVPDGRMCEKKTAWLAKGGGSDGLHTHNAQFSAPVLLTKGAFGFWHILVFGRVDRPFSLYQRDATRPFPPLVYT